MRSICIKIIYFFVLITQKYSEKVVFWGTSICCNQPVVTFLNVTIILNNTTGHRLSYFLTTYRDKHARYTRVDCSITLA